MDEIKPAALIDLALEVTRHFKPFEDAFPITASDRLYQTYHIRIEPEQVLKLANHYREVYRYGSGILPKHTKSTRRKHSSPEDIDSREMMAFLIEKYPDDDPELLSRICQRVILYEYLL